LNGGQSGIAVSPAAFAGFRLSVPNTTEGTGPIQVTAGQSIALTVRAVDAFGNTVTGYTGKVHITSTDAHALLPADYTFTAADAGVHTFPVALTTSTAKNAVWTFSVVDTSNAASLATLTSFEVTNAAAAKFALSVPTNITPGTPFTLKVSVLDAYGNEVKNYFGTIHFANTVESVGLPADYTFTAADAGVHTFTVTSNTTGN